MNDKQLCVKNKEFIYKDGNEYSFNMYEESGRIITIDDRIWYTIHVFKKKVSTFSIKFLNYSRTKVSYVRVNDEHIYIPLPKNDSKKLVAKVEESINNYLDKHFTGVTNNKINNQLNEHFDGIIGVSEEDKDIFRRQNTIGRILK